MSGWLARQATVVTVVTVAMVAACFALPLDASAGEPVEDGAVEPVAEVINVPGARLYGWRSYRRVHNGIAAYEKLRGRHGPLSALRFKLRTLDVPEGPGVPPAQVRLSWDGGELPLALDSDATFSIPVPPPEEAREGRIELNRRKSTYSIVAQVRTSGLDTRLFRLGDLRLECETMWAIEQDDVPFLLRTGITALGGPCKSSNGYHAVRSDTRIASASLQYGDRRLALSPSPDGRTVYPPLFDASWPDDALIRLEPAEEK